MPSRKIEEIPFGNIIDRFSTIAAQPGAVLLDSGTDQHELARYDIISCSPASALTVSENKGALEPKLDGKIIAETDIFSAISDMLEDSDDLYNSSLPFIGGVIGYLGYDLNQIMEKLAPPSQSSCSLPLAYIGRYDWALIQDRVLHKAWLVASSEQGFEQAQAMKQTLLSSTYPKAASFVLTSELASNFHYQSYQDAVNQIKDYILAGDCYQVNLAQCFSSQYQGDSWLAYKALRTALPSPFSAYINTGDGELLSFSPERFLQTEHSKIETRPIKGTRPRSSNEEQDQLYAEELCNSAKDKAENLMIVDLLRNDLGRSCEDGSIRVEQLFGLESYKNVHHLVSKITGHLKPNITAIDALKNAFPGGSITGAPKIRAMEIINELEQTGRNAYCGNIFYASDHGRLDSNITIRSVLADGDSVYCWGGGGIVADSEPKEEYAESLNKIQLILDTLNTLR
jgi:para-aminobenzoate synthetase component 1|tara:strand:+ start:623 stop:1990 length:1368 start_codon:yes stop_codon:yes gene_type:complete